MPARESIRRFEDLEIWQRARRLVNEIYDVSESGSFGHDFELRRQMTRAAISIVSNVAEGFDRFSHAEFRYFLSVSKGSCAELRAQLYLALDRDYIDQSEFHSLQAQVETIGKQISSLMNHLNPKPKASRT